MRIFKKIILPLAISAAMLLSALSVSADTGPYWYNLIDFSDSEEKITDLTFASNKYISGDFTGDGKCDYASIVKTGDDEIDIILWESQGTTFKDPVIHELYSSLDLDKADGMIKSGDFNGDGKDEIGYLYDDPNSTFLRFYVINFSPNSVTQTLWWSIEGAVFCPDFFKNRCVAGDFNGDGKDDFAVLYKSSNSIQFRVFTTNSTGTATSSLRSWGNALNYDETKIADRVVSGDFDGDGKDDIGVLYDNGNANLQIHCFISTGTAFTQSTWYSVSQFSVANMNSQIISGDFNGDGKDEIKGVYNFSTGKSRVFTWKKGSSNSFSMSYVDYSNYNTWIYTTKRLQSGDFNGDGKCDAAFMAKESANNVNSYNIKLYLASSAGTSHSLSTGYTAALSQNFTTTSSITDVYTKPQNKGTLIASLPKDTAVTILGYESFSEYNGATFDDVKYYYVEFDSSYGKSRGYMLENYAYGTTVKVPSMNYGKYSYRPTQPASYFNTNLAYHGPDTSYKSFDDVIPSNTTITILDCVKYDSVNNQYWFWVEFNSSSVIKRGFLTADTNLMR